MSTAGVVKAVKGRKSSLKVPGNAPSRSGEVSPAAAAT